MANSGKRPRVAKAKNGIAPRVCVVCGLPFEWRKKWRNTFDEVKYCSSTCARSAKTLRRGSP